MEMTYQELHLKTRAGETVTVDEILEIDIVNMSVVQIKKLINIAFTQGGLTALDNVQKSYLNNEMKKVVGL